MDMANVRLAALKVGHDTSGICVPTVEQPPPAGGARARAGRGGAARARPGAGRAKAGRAGGSEEGGRGQSIHNGQSEVGIADEGESVRRQRVMGWPEIGCVSGGDRIWRGQDLGWIWRGLIN
jgi:hypothetical protein